MNNEQLIMNNVLQSKLVHCLFDCHFRLFSFFLYLFLSFTLQKYNVLLNHTNILLIILSYYLHFVVVLT